MNRQQRRAAARRQDHAKSPVGPANSISDANSHVRTAMRLHQAGQLVEAFKEYDAALAIDPVRPEALNLKGALLTQTGRGEEGVDLMRQAVIADPTYVEARFNLGSQLLTIGRPEEALPHLKEALRLRPDFTRAAVKLGQACAATGESETGIHALRHAVNTNPSDGESVALLCRLLSEAGAVEEANAHLDAAIRTPGDNPEDLYQIGTACARLDRFEEAVTILRKATRIRPDFVEALSNLGAALVSAQRSAEAIAPLERAVSLQPGNLDTLNNYGCALVSAGRPLDAVAIFQRLTSSRPTDHATLVNRGNAERGAGLREDAEASYRAVLSDEPDHPHALNNLCIVLKMQDRLAEAVEVGRRAIDVAPQSADAHANLASALQLQGRSSEALKALAKAIDLDPGNMVAGSNHLMSLAYSEDASPIEIAEAHRDWGRRIAAACDRSPTRATSREPDRVLRVGFVSPDFRSHAVSRFFEPLLRSLDRSAFHPICISNSSVTDDVTKRLMDDAAEWRSVVGRSMTESVQLIHDLEIDILIDLAGHTAGNRLDVFACKPAPVQMTWLGYPNTTGLDSIQYRITDGRADPEGESDETSAEMLIRLPDCFHCFVGDEDAPAPDLSSQRALCGLTLGSFNNTAKLSDRTIELWAKALTELPDATLLLKGHGLADPGTADHVISRFEKCASGVTLRIELVGWTRSTAEHMALYNRIDVALDPTPYNGTTTTCEAMWMGAPVVTLASGAHAGRVGASLLAAVGLENLIARSEQEYVSIIAELAADRGGLLDLKRRLRDQMMNSALCDADRFARSFESALRNAWRTWCADQ